MATAVRGSKLGSAMNSDKTELQQLNVEAPATVPPSARVMKRRSLLRLASSLALGVPPLAFGARSLLGRGSQSPVQTMAKMSAAEAPNGRLRRWSMVIDLRSCDGCQSVGKPPQCTAACIEGHFVPEPMEWIQVFEQELPGTGTRFLPAPCQQCQNPPCTNVCPVGATFCTPEGPVLIDQNRCIGCRICMAACPYDRRFFNWGTPPQPVGAQDKTYDVEHQTPAQRGTVMKCDFCPDMARAGSLPYCAQACPNNAIYYGDLEEDIATNGKKVIQISSFLSQNSGFRLSEEYGTEPRVYYIPGVGEAVGRNPSKKGRLATIWPWTKVASGSRIWSR
jgi:dimethyl sulfoxide reductase iron-sulfur subunit